MKGNINLILTLMALCVVGVIGLQSFWNYQNYRSTVDTFQRDVNEAMGLAARLELQQRQRGLVAQVKVWLADTSFISITCDQNNRDSNTVFHIQDRHPKFAGSLGMSFSVETFKPKLDRITPEAKRFVVNHFGEKLFRSDMQKRFVYYYTPRLGDSLTVAFDRSHVNLATLDILYAGQLRSKGIRASFVLNPNPDYTSDVFYLTKPVNTALWKPTNKDVVRAGFESPDSYFLRRMRWVILSTLVLVAVCLLCFGYTVKTLLSQQKLAELKEDFVNNMTHELNTPLASLKITAEALTAFDYEPERRKEYLAIIGYQIQKLTDLTARILDINRVTAASRQNWQSVNLRELLDQAIRDMAVRCSDRQATITYQPPAAPAVVYGEAANLATAFTNLIDNALKYASIEPSLTITLLVSDRRVEITFADNGPGIPVEYRTKVFSPFFRIPRGNVHDVKGYGLGLSYVDQVIRQHRGSVAIHANGSGGSQIVIELPSL